MSWHESRITYRRALIKFNSLRRPLYGLVYYVPYMGPSGTIIGKHRITGGAVLVAGQYQIGCFPTLADCQSFFNDDSDNYDSACSNAPYVLGCTNALGFDDYPNVNFTTGSWNKYWKPCGRIIGVHCNGYTFGFAWMQSQFRVSIWDCP